MTHSNVKKLISFSKLNPHFHNWFIEAQLTVKSRIQKYEHGEEIKFLFSDESGG